LKLLPRRRPRPGGASDDPRRRTFARPDLTTFCRLEELGLVVVGQHLEPKRAVLACRVAEDDRWSHKQRTG